MRGFTVLQYPYLVGGVWNTSQGETLYQVRARGRNFKRNTDHMLIYFRFQSLSPPLSMVTDKDDDELYSLAICERITSTMTSCIHTACAIIGCG